MSDVPSWSGRKVAQPFVKLGWQVVRHGNHIILVKSGHIASLSVPDHKEVARGTPRSLLRRSGVSVEELVKAWE